jgi:hypothetical protein
MGRLTHAAQIGAAQLAQRPFLEGIELQVKLEARHVLGEAAGEFGVGSDARAVGIDHQVADGAGAGEVQDAEEVGMQGGFAAGDLHHVGMALIADHGVEHPLDGSQVAVEFPFRAAGGVADGASEVAEVVDLHQRQARLNRRTCRVFLHMIVSPLPPKVHFRRPAKDHLNKAPAYGPFGLESSFRTKKPEITF